MNVVFGLSATSGHTDTIDALFDLAVTSSRTVDATSSRTVFNFFFLNLYCASLMIFFVFLYSAPSSSIY